MMSSPWKRVLGNMVAVAVSVIVGFGVTEAGLRLVKPTSPKGTTYGKPIRRNADGFRDRDYAIPKPPGTLRILVLGDSFTWGVGLDETDALPRVLERRLNEPQSTIATRYEVVHSAIPGFNTAQELKMLKTRGLRYEPDLVLLIYNLNDIEYKAAESDPEVELDVRALPADAQISEDDAATYSVRTGLRGVLHWAQVRSEVVSLVSSRTGALLRRWGWLSDVRYSWVEKIFQGYTDRNPGWIQASESLREIARVTRERQIPLVIGIYPLLVELDRYRGDAAHDRLHDLCSSLTVKCVDFLPLFRNTNGRSYWINFLDSHPNATAHRMVADFLFKEIRGHLLRSSLRD